MTDIAISVQSLSKCYHMYETPRDRLKQFVLPRMQHFIGKQPKQYFNEFWALKDVSFEIKKGETVGIIGRNGSGKSTLLQMICGTLTPTGGSIETNGRIAALLELGSGFNPEFTGRENVYMNAAVLGLTMDEVDTRFDAIAAFADIGNFIEQPVKTYSSGMYVRLAFAVNIISEPEIMIVDEALAVGDMVFQAKCMTALTRIQDRGATVLFVSHDISALKSLCTQGVYLERGLVKKIGNAGEVAELYVRNMREEMNAEVTPTNILASAKQPTKVTSKVQELKTSKEFKISEAFEKQMAQFRYGDGGVKITYVELLDDEMQPIREVGFNQSVLIRVYFESTIEAEVSCNYYVLDDKRNFILGAGLRLAGQPLMHVENGGRYFITYRTRLPLEEASYSLQLQITTPIALDQSARFLDVIENALIFKVSRRQNARLWSKVYIENEVEITFC